MLTLVPGAMGGSETYARALARTLAARRTLDVTAFVPSLAPDAGEGLPTEVVEEYRAATTQPVVSGQWPCKRLHQAPRTPLPDSTSSTIRSPCRCPGSVPAWS
jgi:hypothetical protein